MKKLAVLFAAFIISISVSFAGSNPELSEEINQKVIVDLSDIDLNIETEDFVIVRFSIVNGAIQIQGVQGSNFVLEKIILDKLDALEIEATCDEKTVFAFKFTFEKQ